MPGWRKLDYGKRIMGLRPGIIENSRKNIKWIFKKSYFSLHVIYKLAFRINIKLLLNIKNPYLVGHFIAFMYDFKCSFQTAKTTSKTLQLPPS
jgi:hypothetical protein